jgi:flagellum-specific peptidoglycan hydrolase FlgJ
MFQHIRKKLLAACLLVSITATSLPVHAYVDSDSISQITSSIEDTEESTSAETTTQKETTTKKAVTKVNFSLKATAFRRMSTRSFIAALGPIAQADAKKSGVLASVTLAQAILESGWGKSQLAQKANNLFGMKTSLSGNTWKGSTWNKKSVYKKRTAEYGKNNRKYYITASFRKYSTVYQSISDHSAYLTGAKNGKSYRYKGLTSTKSYKKQLTIIRKGGYATSKTYVSDLCKIIKKYKLYEWDV